MMRSIRRTILPAQHQFHDRALPVSLETKEKCQMGYSSPRSSSSPNPQRLFSFVFFVAAGLRRMGLGKFGIFISKSSCRKPWQQQSYWQRSLHFFLFFLLGFLLGLAPFFDLESNSSVLPNTNHGMSSPRRELGSVSRPDGAVSRLNEIPPVNIVVPKLLLIVTPTYNRPLQSYYLHRLGQTLSLVPPPLLWIVVETGYASDETADVLRRTRVMYRHLVCKKNSTEMKDRGVHQRNTALEHIERHRLDGIVYFADDDNIYALQLFLELRGIRRFGTWPVAMLAQSKSRATLEGSVCNGSLVIGWNTNEKSKNLRRFHVDMSGFAFNSSIIWDPKRWHLLAPSSVRQLDTVKEGFQETTFIEQIVEDESQMEGLPHGCSKIMNWHLHLDAKRLVYPRFWKVSSNLEVVVSLTKGI
ncbi:hypothetical protein HPP92_012693 [Vanilla planifolia]|uniref:Glycosyltransferases n=1 Tax=Vanilla planifolia TaxID=51239 RepID=A0A835UVS7_VANPL|nr:hypothetical protein HPP92_012693 [Vanilla planifolia]